MMNNQTNPTHQGFLKAATYCSRTERCERDVRTKLAEWNVPEEVFGDIIVRLKKEKFLDNTRYTAAFVKDKTRFAKWGRLKIVHALRQKGIAESLITEALAQLPDEANTELLAELLLAKAQIIKYKDHFDRREKLIRFALSRGFEYETIKKVMSDKL